MTRTKHLPDSLWKDSCLYLWPHLISALRDELSQRDRLFEASGENISEREIQRGTSAEVALKHFVHRFKTSAARVEYVLLDPFTTFDRTSRQLSTSLCDGVVALLDAPCGSGGGLFGLLCTLAEMRSKRLIPILPLDLSLLAADVCPAARAIHSAMVERMREPLAHAGIRLRCEYEQWDVTNRLSTTALMKRFAELYPRVEDTVIFVSAFSEFASQSSENSERVLEAIADIIKSTYDKHPALAWIEPMTKDAGGMIRKLYKSIRNLIGQPEQTLPDGIAEKFTFMHPFNTTTIVGRAQILPIEKVVV